ncbi:DUF4344 domain-containing metallopeptidase [Streptomyces sp. NPDC051561]|uniref:DUF4344 domain-containing metallopeptidase n=1 Tax=Streptomyces sp. NPDC051561 TaxID=3365658 RepID=UPI0037AD2414
MFSGESEKSGARAEGLRSRTGRAPSAATAFVLALLPLPGCGNPAETTAPRPVLSVRYEAPANAADRRDAEFLREGRTVEEAADALAGFVRWGERKPVPLVVRSCGGEGPSYDPEARRIELCYDELSETRELFRESGAPRPADGALRSVFLESLHHESAHALIDALGLNLPGNEEDAADRFAALMLLRKGESGERHLLDAAETWQKSSELYEEAAGDEHASDRERAAAMRCYVYGAAPARHRGLVPGGDGAGCEEKWATARTGWTDALRAAGTLPPPHAPSPQT